MKWIKIEDELPVHGEKVLVVFKDQYDWYRYPTSCKLATWYCKNYLNQYWQDAETLHPLFGANTITHWMPLPDKPQQP